MEGKNVRGVMPTVVMLVGLGCFFAMGDILYGSSFMFPPESGNEWSAPPGTSFLLAVFSAAIALLICARNHALKGCGEPKGKRRMCVAGVITALIGIGVCRSAFFNRGLVLFVGMVAYGFLWGILLFLWGDYVLRANRPLMRPILAGALVLGLFLTGVFLCADGLLFEIAFVVFPLFSGGAVVMVRYADNDLARSCVDRPGLASGQPDYGAPRFFQKASGLVTVGVFCLACLVKMPQTICMLLNDNGMEGLSKAAFFAAVLGLLSAILLADVGKFKGGQSLGTACKAVVLAAIVSALATLFTGNHFLHIISVIYTVTNQMVIYFSWRLVVGESNMKSGWFTPVCFVLGVQFLGSFAGTMSGLGLSGLCRESGTVMSLLVSGCTLGIVATYLFALGDVCSRRPPVFGACRADDVHARRCSWIAEQYGLTNREAEVLCLIAAGRSGTYIQKHLGLSKSTVSTYWNNIYKKIGIHSKQEIIDIVLNTDI